MQQLPNNNIEDYSLIEFPFGTVNGPLNDYTNEQVKSFGKWFFAIKNQRLNYLCNKLFSSTIDCLKEENISVVEMFLLHNVTYRKVTEEEKRDFWQGVSEHLKPVVKMHETVFKEPTTSIYFDIGIFLGELLISLDKHVKWQQEMDKKFYYYGRVVLVTPFSKADLNPITSAGVCASKIKDGEYSEGEMQRMFNYWKKIFKIGDNDRSVT